MFKELLSRIHNGYKPNTVHNLPQKYDDIILPLTNLSDKLILGGSLGLYVMGIVEYDFKNRKPDIDFSLTEPLTEDELVLVDKAVIESKPVVKEKPKVISSKPIKPKESKKTKADIIEYIEVETGISKNKSNKFLKFFAQVVKETLAEGKDVDIPGFGKFTTIEMPAKKAMNPQTNEEIIVPAHNQARLRFDDIFKDKFEVK